MQKRIDDLTVTELANIFSKVEFFEGLMELSDNLYSVLKCIPNNQLENLKCHKTLPNLIIRIVNETEKILIRNNVISPYLKDN